MRMWLIVVVDLLYYFPCRVLRSVRAGAVFLRAHRAGVIRIERGLSRVGAIAPGPHALLRIRSRSPGRGFLPFFFGGQTFTRPCRISRRIGKVNADDRHLRLTEIVVVPPGIRGRFSLRRVTKLLVLFIRDFERIYIKAGERYLVRRLLLRIMIVVS